MKRYISKICWMVALATAAVSCDFLDEDPKTFLSPKAYYTTEAQVVAAVNGVYTFLDDIFNGDIERGTQTYLFMDYLAGYAIRPYAGASTSIYQTQNLTVAEDNNIVAKFWETSYLAIENCNSVIEGIATVTDERNIMSAASRDKLLGEVYFLRAHFYFNLVRLFGEVPLKTESTQSLNTEIALSPQADIYARIEADLAEAERLMSGAGAPMVGSDGRISLGAVKSLFAKVYLTEAGYPLQKGTEYYAKAYQKAGEVVSGGSFSLAANYAALRAAAFSNSGEYIWSLQRNADNAGSPVHNNTLPYPAPSKPISANSDSGGSMAPHISFYESYDEGDLRVAEKGFFYTEHEASDGSGMVTLSRPYIYKWWDESASKNARSGANYPFIRYADVLLMMAEAKANADGGTTGDAAAVNAYWQVRSRALPDGTKPSSISVNEVIKERIHELCFEDQTWFDMLRTRKGLNVTTGQIVNLVGLHTPAHAEGAVYGEDDLLFPYPIREVRLNPNLVRQ